MATQRTAVTADSQLLRALLALPGLSPWIVYYVRLKDSPDLQVSFLVELNL